ncbi:MAG: hypothetical protein ABI700_01790 [Chloroflexota bacterium]
MILCLRIPEFMTVVERRVHPEWNTPLIFLRHVGKQERVYAASEDSEGVRPGMRLSQAQALCPEGLLLPVTFMQCANTLRTLVEALCQFSQVMEVKDDFHEDLLVYLDLGTLRPSAGFQLAQGIQNACADMRLKANMGIAAGKFTAWVAAQRGGIHLVRPGEEAAFLALLPITLLPLEREMERVLPQYGVTRIGQLAAWSKTAMVAEFGPPGLAVLKLAQGQDNRALRRYRLSNREQILRTFEAYPIETDAELIANLNEMIHQLALRLERSSSATQQLSLVLHLEGGASVEKTLDFRQPLAHEAELQRTIHRALEHVQLAAPTIGIELTCDLLVADLPRQLSLWEYAEAQQRKTEKEIKRLVKRFPSQHFGHAVPNEPNNPLPERRYRVEALNE